MLMDIMNAARELGIGQGTLRRWIREGRLGRRVLLRPEVLKEMIASNEVPSAEGADTENTRLHV